MRRTFKAVPEPVDTHSAELAAELGLPAKCPDGPRLIIGRREWLALPDLGVMLLHAKTDSGARSSSLHAENIELSSDQRSVRFTTTNVEGELIHCETAVVRFGRVRSSTGVAKKRIFIETTAVLCGGFRWKILVSLARRSDMICPILLGRRALAGYFLIEPLGTNLLGGRRQMEREIQRAIRRDNLKPETKPSSHAAP